MTMTNKQKMKTTIVTTTTRALVVALAALSLVLSACKMCEDDPRQTPTPKDARAPTKLAVELDEALAALGLAVKPGLKEAVATDLRIARLLLEAERVRFNDADDSVAPRAALANDVGIARAIASAATTDGAVDEHIALTRALFSSAKKTLALLPARGSGSCVVPDTKALLEVAQSERALREPQPGDMSGAALADVISGDDTPPPLPSPPTDPVPSPTRGGPRTPLLPRGTDLAHLDAAARTSLGATLSASGKVGAAAAATGYLTLRGALGPGSDRWARELAVPSWKMDDARFGRLIDAAVARGKQVKATYERDFDDFELAHALLDGDTRNIVARRDGWLRTGETGAVARGAGDDALRDAQRKALDVLGPCLRTATAAQIGDVARAWLAASSFLTQPVPCQGSPAICTADPLLGCTAGSPAVCGEKCGATVCGVNTFCDGTACRPLGAGRTCTTDADCTGTVYTQGFSTATSALCDETLQECVGLGWRCEQPDHCGKAQECNQTTNHCEPQTDYECSATAECKADQGCQQLGGKNRCVNNIAAGDACAPAFLADDRVAPTGPCQNNGRLVGAGATLVCRAQPKVELCNGVDEDCDFVADDQDKDVTGLVACAHGGNVCTDAALQQCKSGVATCVDGPPKTEVCNNTDDDCDGSIDERPDCPARCGDGRLDPGEECDDGNGSDNDKCRNDCTSVRCGDGRVDQGEQCDDGNQTDNDGCRNSCASPRCGDSVVQAGEECDDGNNENGDGCRNSCRNPRCGDGIKDGGEGCDDGNGNDQDGCTNACQLPPKIILSMRGIDDDAYAWIGTTTNVGLAICTHKGAMPRDNVDTCDLGAQMRARLNGPVDATVTLRIINAGCWPTAGDFFIDVNDGRAWTGEKKADSGTSVHCGWTYKAILTINPYTGAVTPREETVCHWPTDSCWWE